MRCFQPPSSLPSPWDGICLPARSLPALASYPSGFAPVGRTPRAPGLAEELLSALAESLFAGVLRSLKAQHEPFVGRKALVAFGCSAGCRRRHHPGPCHHPPSSGKIGGPFPATLPPFGVRAGGCGRQPGSGASALSQARWAASVVSLRAAVAELLPYQSGRVSSQPVGEQPRREEPGVGGRGGRACGRRGGRKGKIPAEEGWMSPLHVSFSWQTPKSALSPWSKPAAGQGRAAPGHRGWAEQLG